MSDLVKIYQPPNPNLINFHKTDDSINTPSKSHPTDAGWDLPSADAVSICSGQRLIVDTGISLETPVGYFAMITPRSGLAAKHGITIVNSPGIIDSHYRGNIKVILLNTGDSAYLINKNDRIAQLFFVAHLAGVSLNEVEKLNDTDRGEGGLGSTGK